MKKLVIACQKGGVGKSTLCLNLLIEALKRGQKAAIVDLDDQESCELMASQRERLHGQRLPVFSKEPEGYDLLIYDTPPHANSTLLALFEGADLVLLPVKPATLDLAAATSTLTVAKRSGVKYAVVLMLPVARSPEIAEAKDWLSAQGAELGGIVHHRIDIARAAGQGLGISELDDKNAGGREFAWVADFAFAAMK